MAAHLCFVYCIRITIVLSISYLKNVLISINNFNFYSPPRYVQHSFDIVCIFESSGHRTTLCAPQDARQSLLKVTHFFFVELGPAQHSITEVTRIEFAISDCAASLQTFQTQKFVLFPFYSMCRDSCCIERFIVLRLVTAYTVVSVCATCTLEIMNFF